MSGARLPARGEDAARLSDLDSPAQRAGRGPARSSRAAVHAAWALGLFWPADSERELAEHVLSSGERERLDGNLPPAPITWLVALGLVGAAAIVSAVARGTRSRALRGAGWGVAAIFYTRGLIYPPLDLIRGLHDPYNRLDLAFYSPLCVALAIAITLALRRTARATA